jgi:hypothetical protein
MTWRVPPRHQPLPPQTNSDNPTSPPHPRRYMQDNNPTGSAPHPLGLLSLQIYGGVLHGRQTRCHRRIRIPPQPSQALAGNSVNPLRDDIGRLGRRHIRVLMAKYRQCRMERYAVGFTTHPQLSVSRRNGPAANIAYITREPIMRDHKLSPTPKR